MNISIDKNKTINHYCYDDDELFNILRDSVKTLDRIYERLRDSDEFDDDECNRVYNIIDILWDMELLS
jgi:hypothetical protein